MTIVFVLSITCALAVGVLIGLFVAHRTQSSGMPEGALAAVDQTVHAQVRSHAAVLQQDLRHVSELVGALRRDHAEQDGRLSAELKNAMSATARLAESAQSLQQALASPKARGQWGERMAQDVLRVAGFVEGINYSRQLRQSAGTVPDFTFHLPKGHVVHMDVKFPIDNYLRWLEAEDDDLRGRLATIFAKDVRNRIRELKDRDYIDPDHTVDELLLFIPNESVYGFIHEHDRGLIDFAVTHKVVLCSPTSLFAVLAVIRQAVDNFLVERQSDEILASVAGVRSQWNSFVECTEKIARGLQSAQSGLADLTGVRTRSFEKQLGRLEGVRDRHKDADPHVLGDLESIDGGRDTVTAALPPPLWQVR